MSLRPKHIRQNPSICGKTAEYKSKTPNYKSKTLNKSKDTDMRQDPNVTYLSMSDYLTGGDQRSECLRPCQVRSRQRHTCITAAEKSKKRAPYLHETTRLAWDYKTYMRLQVQDPKIQVQDPKI